MSLLLFYLLLALLVSFFCSIAEVVILSTQPAYISTLEKKGRRGARALKALRANLERPLSAILTLNTVAHTVGAAGVGAQAANIFGNKYLGLCSAILTFLILVFSEILPKSLGAMHWKSLAPLMGILIYWLTIILHPFVWFFERMTRVITSGAVRPSTFSRDEMQAMAEIGAKEGILELKELKVVKNLLRLNKLTVRDLITPRSVLFALSANMTVADFFRKHENKPFSRIPIYKESKDDISAYVLKNDLIIAQAKDEFSRKLNEFSRDFIVFPQSISASLAFDKLTRQRSHIALVVDEYGVAQGIISLEDIIETLIGLEIVDEQDTIEDLQVFAREQWRKRMQALGIQAEKLQQFTRN